MTFKLQTVFEDNSGSSLLKAAQNIANHAMDTNPVKNSDGSISRDENGTPYVDPDAARAAISKQSGDLQERILKDMRGSLTEHGAADIREHIGNLKKLEIAHVCVDLALADSPQSTPFHQKRLAKAMNGLSPANPDQRATSTVLETALNSKLDPKTDLQERVSIRAEHSVF